MELPRFAVRAKAKELAGEVTSLRGEVEHLRSEMDRLGLLEVVELERRRDGLLEEIAEQNNHLRDAQAAHTARLEEEAKARQAKSRDAICGLEEQKRQLDEELVNLRQEVVVTKETALLQEAGIYEYRHPLDDAVAYQAELARLRDSIRAMTRREGGAVSGTTNWSVNGSAAQGRKMVRDFSKLMLRAYNAEADNLARGLKAYKLDSAIDRLTKVATTIAKLGLTMDIAITQGYHRLRVTELELTADHAEKVAEEKERERDEKICLREERQAQRELQRERAKLEKEKAHYENAVRALLAKGDNDGAAGLRERLDEIGAAIEDVDFRAANVRAGYVYVISNVGAFGSRVIKVGMTRRLDPLDRVRELGDASVPFRFDVHALFFSEDAVGIESELHGRLEDRRVNLVNRRREFFYANPAEVKEHLTELAGELLQFEESPEALEYHQSQNQTADHAKAPV
ncbi:MAG: DUF4041 domain-containing protein [Nocardioidaceae bacterium]